MWAGSVLANRHLSFREASVMLLWGLVANKTLQLPVSLELQSALLCSTGICKRIGKLGKTMERIRFFGVPDSSCSNLFFLI